VCPAGISDGGASARWEDGAPDGCEWWTREAGPVVFAGTRSIAVEEEVADAVLEEPDDVVVRISSGAICASDLHMCDGWTRRRPDCCGHEPLDVIEQVGSAVEMVEAGDREAAMSGVPAGLDTVGFRAHDRQISGEENPSQLVGDRARLLNPLGHLGNIGVDPEKDLRAVPEGHPGGHRTVPWATFFSKGVSLGFGRTHDRRDTVLPRDLAPSGRARPAVVVTPLGGLEDDTGLYRAFDQRADGDSKAVLHP
jgi:threonine dehydrogenase-like Zn-dependent dehydrogenase